MLIRVHACAVCRTDLHVVDGELTQPKLPLIPGHEIVGHIAARGDGADRFAVGDRVGVPWLGWTCGVCEFCRSGRENLCAKARFTGYQIDGGYSEYTIADQRFCFAMPVGYSDVEAAAPLLSRRADRLPRAAHGRRGAASRTFYGFGDSAHILTQIARWQGREVYAFTSPGDIEAQRVTPATLARCGPTVPIRRPQKCWTPPSSSHPSGHWCPRRCVPSSAAAQLFARAST